MGDFPNSLFNVQEDQNPEATAVYRCPFTLYELGHGESDPGQDAGAEYVYENALFRVEDDNTYDPLLRSLDEFLSGLGPEQGGVEGVADGGVRVGGMSPDSDTEAVDLRANGDLQDFVFDRYFGSFADYGMEEANPIEVLEVEESEGLNNGSHYLDMAEGFENFEGSSRFSAPQEQRDQSENFSRPFIEILLPSDLLVTLNMEIDRSESSSRSLAAEGSQESSSVSHYSDIDLDIAVGGTESSSDLGEEQQLLEDSSGDLHGNAFDMDMEVERTMPSTPLSSIQEEIDTLGYGLTSTSQTLLDASLGLTSTDPFGLINHVISMRVVGNDNDLMGRTTPAAKSVAENLPLVKVGKEDLKDGSALVCAVCTNEIIEEEMVNRLPCWHYYHGECILPWLRVKNTCPLCRYELPTDDQDYESSTSRRA